MNINRWSDYKKLLYREVVVSGLTTLEPGTIGKLFPFGCEVAPERLGAWLDRFLRGPKVDSIRPVPRLINRFKLGADPEFVFVTPAVVEKKLLGYDEDGKPKYVPVTVRPEAPIPADSVGLKAGVAFGADNNGRLVEVRPYASRSALEVVASIYSTLRWLAVIHPDTKKFEWHCGAYKFRDGLGGHVHFGRKRPSSPAAGIPDGLIRRGRQGRVGPEVQALDVLSGMFEELALFPQPEMIRRREGDQFKQRYGLPADYRMQNHGYEYRTYPSWLDSPWLALFVLTLSKLAVLNPHMILDWQGGKVPQAVMKQRIKNLLAYYRGVDDDARLVRLLIDNLGLPTWKGGDFKARWGCNVVKSLHKPQFVPNAIPAGPKDIDDIFKNLLYGEAFYPLIEQKPTWEPTKLPEGYFMLNRSLTTTHNKGLGEMLWDVCGHTNFGPLVHGARERAVPGGYLFGISPSFAELLPTNWRAEVKKIDPEAGIFTALNRDGYELGIPISTRENPRDVHRTKKILLSGLFPFWHVKQVNKDSYEKWKAISQIEAPPKNPEEGFKGKVLYQDKGGR